MIIALASFAAIAPTLAWLEFSSGSENLVVEAVLEMRRGGPWLIPTLAGAPRTSKPPLPTWICAAFVRPDSVDALSQRETRDAVYRRLAWEVRWPALLVACLTLIAGAWLGRALLVHFDGGIITAVLMATSALYLRFGRSMSTDVHLALWVTLANAFFVVGILKHRPWLAATMGGLALGLALMSKGPVALAQTVAPLAVFGAWRRWTKNPLRIRWTAVGLAAVIALALALPWPIVAATRLQGQAQLWFNEVALGGAKNYAFDPPWVYLALVPLLLPWAGFFVLGLVALWRERSDRAVLALALTLVPVVIMCCFTEKNDRYLLPMLAPAAVVAAAGFASRERDLAGLRAGVTIFTWGFLAVLSVGLPLAGALYLREAGADRGHWWPIRVGVAAAVALLAVVVVARRVDPGDGRRTLLPAGVIVMLLANAMFIHGYAQSERGRSDGRPIADAIVAALPADAPVWVFDEPNRFRRAPVDTVIYLNRVVRPVTNPAELQRDRPVAVLVHCRPGQAMPAAMAGWRVIGAMPKNQGMWNICVPPESRGGGSRGGL